MALIKLLSRPEVFIGTIILLASSATISFCMPVTDESESLTRIRRQQLFDEKLGAIKVAMEVLEYVMVRDVYYAYMYTHIVNM